MRPTEEALSAVLKKNRFRFMNHHSKVSLEDVYQVVEQSYAMLCVKDYK